jgi:hypothetical protein
MGKAARIKKERKHGERKKSEIWDKVPNGMFFTIPPVAALQHGAQPGLVPLPSEVRRKRPPAKGINIPVPKKSAVSQQLEMRRLLQQMMADEKT